MRKRVTIIAIIVLAVVAVAYLLFFGGAKTDGAGYQLAALARGDIENTVSATGVLSPVTTVEVGTQVSGTLASVFVDFNDTVKAGQILAVVDTVLLHASVVESQATLERTEAQLKQAKADYQRGEELFDKSLISEEEFLPYEVSLKTQEANLKSAQASLLRAKQNLDYAVIRAPITGIVIDRSVEAGQTVAASLSTPTLFLIAQDLSRMEILAEVDESDIGVIKEGQEVRFEVAAYSDKEFSGKVKQVRMQPQTISNVVTYTAVVEAENPDGLLLPGMTATVDFITDKRTDVLLVPAKALRFQPSAEQLAAFQEKMKERFASRRGGEPGDSTGGGMARQGGGFGGQGMSGNRGGNGSFGMVWYLDSLGQLAGAPLRTGLTDGTNTEVVGSRALTEGMEIIVGTAAETSNSTQQSSNMMGGPSGFRGPPPGF
ncbi:MAG: efflux RND transporter periplasmic adaptor subunit [bacterium]